MDGLAGSELILSGNGRSYTRPELLAYWIQEREQIRLLKEMAPGQYKKPWSNDWVFQETYFCNVRREDDKVTRWIRENYTPANMGSNYEFSICVARIFNRPETLANIFLSVKDGNFGYIREVLRQMQELGQQIWSGAYLITTHGRKMTKLDYCLEILEKAYVKFQEYGEGTGPNSCQAMHHFVMGIEGFGSFLAAQVVADLKNTEGHPLRQADDWYAFSAPGPGSLRGLSWFHNRTISEATYQQAILDVKGYLGSLYNEYRLHMQDLQNCLCEFDKYCRVVTGVGRSKRKYDGK